MTFNSLGLKRRMMVFLGLFLLVLMVVTALLAAQRDRDVVSQQMQRDGVALAKAYALSIENALILRGAGLARVTGEASRTPGIRYVSILDARSVDIGHTSPSLIGSGVADPLVQEALETPISAVEVGRRPLTRLEADANGKQIFRIVIPLVILDKVEGAMELGLETGLIQDAVDNTNRQTFLLALIAYFVGIVFIIIFSHSLTRPVLNLAEAAERIASGDLSQPIRYLGDNELGHLSGALDRMREKLRGNFAQLEDRADQIEALRRFSENILNSINPGVITLDLDGRISGLNRPAEAMLGLDRARSMGRSYAEVFAHWPELAHAVSSVVQGSTVAVEVLIDARQGGEVARKLVRLYGSALKDSNGQVIGDVLAMDDISFVRSMERRMLDAEKMVAMGELAVGVAHEVRNPLGAIRNAAQFLEGKMDQNDAKLRFPRLIIREADRLNSLVTRLLQYTKPESGAPAHHGIHESIEHAVALAELKIAGSHIKIERDHAPDLPPVRADSRRMLQVFLNLLFNAIDAIPSQGTIRIQTRQVETQPGERQVEIRISDSGKGMSAEVLERMFEPFFTSREGGTGLGLFIVQQIVTEQGGRISAESAPGKGTSVTMILPAYCPAGAEVPA